MFSAIRPLSICILFTALPNFSRRGLQIDQILRKPPSGDTVAFFSVQQICTLQRPSEPIRCTFGARTQESGRYPAVLQLATAPSQGNVQQADGIERHFEHARVVVKVVVVSDPRHTSEPTLIVSINRRARRDEPGDEAEHQQLGQRRALALLDGILSIDIVPVDVAVVGTTGSFDSMILVAPVGIDIVPVDAVLGTTGRFELVLLDEANLLDATLGSISAELGELLVGGRDHVWAQARAAACYRERRLEPLRDEWRCGVGVMRFDTDAETSIG